MPDITNDRSFTMDTSAYLFRLLVFNRPRLNPLLAYSNLSFVLCIVVEIVNRLRFCTYPLFRHMRLDDVNRSSLLPREYKPCVPTVFALYRVPSLAAGCFCCRPGLPCAFNSRQIDFSAVAFKYSEVNTSARPPMGFKSAGAAHRAPTYKGAQIKTQVGSRFKG